MKKLKRIFAILMTLVICVSTVDLSVYATEDSISEPFQETENGGEETAFTEDIISDSAITDENVHGDSDEMATESIYEAESFRVICSLTGQWDGGYNANIRIENTGNSVIENWYLSCEFQNEISNIWNAEIYQKENGKYIIKNAGWNQDIAVGNYVEFGFGGNENFIGFPDKYQLIGGNSETNEGDYVIKYHLDSDWGSGFSGTIFITNNTNTTLEDWSLECDFNREITNIWNAVVESHNENHYVLMNAGYNSNIAAGQTISFGFNGEQGTSTDEPYNFILKTYNPYNDNLMEVDSDNDGIVDGIEIAFGWDPFSDDTDGDGLKDYYEYSVCNLSPLSPDTDNDGINDNEDDEDGDGLSNELECQYNTDPLIRDTDKDGLNDYDEIFVYFTDPLVADTDQDGLEDYDDVKLGFSPLKKDTDENGIIDSQEIVRQTFEQDIIDPEKPAVTKVSVEMSTNGNIDKTTAVSNVNNIDMLSTDVVGLVGVPVEINCSSVFDEAVITFWYNKDELGEVDENNLSVMWYDEEDNFYRLLDRESVIDTDKGTVSYTTTHFSTYMLVDKTQWYDAWKENLDYRTGTSADQNYYDFAFVIDVSGSMSGTRITTAKQALNGFIDALSDNDNACIIKFHSSATVAQGFTNDKSALHNAVSRLSASGGTSVNSGLVQAISQYQTRSESDRQKTLVLLCDGDVNYYENTIQQCRQMGIKIFTVNVGYQSSSAYLKKMSELTGGEYYYCPTAGTIETVLGEICDNTVKEVDPTDTDGDGLFDVYETVGIRLNNGQIIKTDPNKADTDGDGLTDYEEVGIVYSEKKEISSGMTSEVKYVLMVSHPLRPDTDYDGKMDPNDEKPWDYDVVNNLLVYQSKCKKGLKEDGQRADDMKKGDQNRQTIYDINDLFEYQLDEADSPYWGADTLFSELEDMSTSLFSTGDFETVILDMISHFRDGTGTDYVNEYLSKAAYNHESTQKYIDDIKTEITQRLTINGGNIHDLEYKEELKESADSLYHWIENCTEDPTYRELTDIVNGLTICVNDTWGCTVEVNQYTFDGEHFSGTLHFCLYDHFGLDQPDVEKIYVNLAGFRAWYVLQHYDQFNGAYAPFVTLMEYDVPFEGEIVR